MLQRKMWRDLKENKAAYIACIVVIATGLLVFTSVSMVLDNLQGAKESFYRESNFADGFARVKGMPFSEIRRLAGIEGIAAIEGRLVKDVRVLNLEREENVYLRLVSVQPELVNPINGARLLEGEPLQDKDRYIWVSPDFFSANGLKLGDKISVIIEGKKVDLTMVGTAQSPEFVYALRTAQDMYPSPETFGIAYIPFSVMKPLFEEGGLVNDIVFTLKTGYSYQEVEDRLKPRLEAYGLEGLFPRKDQASNVILTQELLSLKGTASSLPVMLLVVASIILYILLRRMVDQQRGQIGTLKAFGYSSRDIVLHYLSYALVIGVFGGFVGGFAGIWLSSPMTRMYQAFFNLPGLQGDFSVKYLLLGMALSTGFSLLAGYQGSKQALKLQPAESLRPPAPPPAKRTAVERLAWFWESLTVQGKMAMRNLFRNKQRSFFTFLGIMFAYIIIATTWYFQDVGDVMIGDQFTKVMAYDVKMTFAAPVSRQEMGRELSRLPGVKRVEPMVEVPATLKYQWRQKDVGLIGLERDAQLYNIYADDGLRVKPPADGILLSSRLAELLGASVGSRLTVESGWARDATQYLMVAGIVPQYLGINAYLEQGTLNQLLRQGDMATSVLLAVDEEAVPVLKDRYRESATVASIEEKNRVLEKYYSLMESYGFMTWLLALFGIITGFAVVYNSSIVSLSERKRELATLMVLGMTPGEALQVLTFEQWFTSFFAMLAGLPLTIAAMHGMARSMNNDIYSIPVLFQPPPFIFALVITSLTIWIAQKTLSRKMRQLSLVDVLKDRE